MKRTNILYNIIPILALTLLSSCEKEATFMVDNPTNKKVVFTLGDLKYSVEDYKQRYYKIQPGEYQLIIEDDTSKIFFKERGRYMLNPTKSTYIVETAIYGDDSFLRKKYEDIRYSNHKEKLSTTSVINKDTLMIVLNNGITIPFSLPSGAEKRNSVLIKNDWDYGVFEDLPETIKARLSNNNILEGNHKKIKKLYRKNTYVYDVKSYFEQRLNE